MSGEVARWMLSCKGNKCCLVIHNRGERTMCIIDREAAETLLRRYLWELLPVPGEIYTRVGECEEDPLQIIGSSLPVSQHIKE